MLTNEIDVSQREEAVILHRAILEKGAAAANALADFCRLLKEMRDSGLYRELGCAEFEDYCINLAGIKARMAYNYIAAYERLGDTYIREHAGLGITKLEVLSRMDEESRAEIEVCAADASVAELKQMQEELSVSGRQIDMLNDELCTKDNALKELDESLKETAEELAEARDKNSELEKLLDAAQSALDREKQRTADMSQDREKALRQEITAELEAGTKKKILAEAKKLAEEKAKKALADAEQTIKLSEEELVRMRNEHEAAIKRVDELERKLRNSDSAVTAAKVHLSAVSENFNKLCELISGTDAEIGERILNAAFTVLKKCEETINSQRKAI